MELKTARLTLLIDPNKKAAFERLCAQQDRTASQVVRQLIREYLIAHGVSYVASGTEESDGPQTEPVPRVPAVQAKAPAPKPKARSTTARAARQRRTP